MTIRKKKQRYSVTNDELENNWTTSTACMVPKHEKFWPKTGVVSQ